MYLFGKVTAFFQFDAVPSETGCWQRTKWAETVQVALGVIQCK